MSKFHQSQFIKEVKTVFPELTSDINADQGLLHLEMEVIRKFAQHLIDTGQREKLVKCFSLVEQFNRSGNAKLKDAIDVSFVEDLNFSATKKKSREWAWELFPNSLKELYISFHGTPTS